MAKYAILSDMHSNLEALKVVLDKCKELEVDHYVSLGDIVGYNADPVACMELVRAIDWFSMVRGNHDIYTGKNGASIDGFNDHAREAVLWTRDQLSQEDRDWLITPPLRTTFQTPEDISVTLVHATLDSPERWGYIFDEHHANDNFAYQFTPLCFCGHSHVPIAFCKKPFVTMSDKGVEEIYSWVELPEDDDFSKPKEVAVRIEIGHKYLFNIGSVGQPRNRDPRASFAVLDTIERTVTRYSIPYDIVTTQEKILAAGLPERLAVRLATGS